MTMDKCISTQKVLKLPVFVIDRQLQKRNLQQLYIITVLSVLQ